MDTGDVDGIPKRLILLAMRELIQKYDIPRKALSLAVSRMDRGEGEETK
jgi:hypothetical protein